MSYVNDDFADDTNANCFRCHIRAHHDKDVNDDFDEDTIISTGSDVISEPIHPPIKSLGGTM